MNEYITVEDVADSLNKNLERARFKKEQLGGISPLSMGRGHFMIVKTLEEATAFTSAYQKLSVTLYYVIKNTKVTVVTVSRTDKTITPEQLFFGYKTLLKYIMCFIFELDITKYITDEVFDIKPTEITL